eukprot:GEMP01015191.1.p1 GENE.GEMP01015191.1~~GEMP01015191.1.p1  ORF type:complete len:292 (+),score=53.37 GEMP01015191.1:169-1044(+)
MEFNMRVPVAFMGGLIGYKGETIQAFKKDTGCDVRIAPKEKTDMRKVSISGNIEVGIEKMFEVFSAQLEKASSGKENGDSNHRNSSDSANENNAAFWCEMENPAERGALSHMKKEQAFAFKVEVASNQVGAVIGKGGKSAESLRQTSHCQVKIQPHGEIEIIGKLEHVSNVMQIIWESIKHTPSRPLPPPAMAQHFNSLSSGPEVEVVLMIPSESVGLLIGKRGEHITQIRRHCVGVKIEISSEEGAARAQSTTHGNVQEFSMDKTMRKVTLRGSISATALCHQILASYLI